MTIGPDEVRFAVKALPAAGSRPNELTRTMAPHPLVYQELPYDPEYRKRCERTTLVFSLTPGRSSRAGVRGSGIEDDRRRSSPACS